MKELKNKIIKKITVSGDYQDFMTFETDQGTFSYSANGDCCSQSYFSEIWGASNILKKKITEVENMELLPGEAPTRDSRQEYDNIYGIKLRIKKDVSEGSVCTIIFRNSSNGYYGGSVDLCNNKDQKDIEREFVITGDWSAPSL